MEYPRIKELRIDNDLTIQKISDDLGLQRDVYSRYEKGIRDFPLDIVIKIANYFDCSIDYLVGRTNNKTMNKDNQRKPRSIKD